MKSDRPEEESRLLVVFIPRAAPLDQSVVVGRARWEGAALHLEPAGGGARLPLPWPTACALLTAEGRAILSESGDRPEVDLLLADAEYIVSARCDSAPAGAVPARGLVAIAQFPKESR